MFALIGNEHGASIEKNAKFFYIVFISKFGRYA